MTTSESTIQYWTERAEQCLAAATEMKKTRSAAARKVAQAYSVAASNWRKAAERANSDDPISRDFVDGNARDGAKFEAIAHQKRHELDGTPIPPEATAYPAPVEDKPAQDEPRRMKAAEVRGNWRDVLDHVRAGNEVVVEHYNKPVARIVPPWTTPEEATPRELAVDPSTILRLDGREEYDQIADLVWCRMTVGITPDSTAVIILEERTNRHGERDRSVPLAVGVVWAYESLAQARCERDRILTDDWTLPSGSLAIRDATI